MTKLDFSFEHAATSSDRPGNDGFLDLARLDGFDHAIFLDTTDFTEKEEDFAVGVGFVTEEMVDECGSGITVAANSDTLVDTVGGLRDDVVEFVGHTTGFGDVSNGTGTVEFRGNNVVHHTTRVSNFEAAGLDASDGGGSNDGDTLLLCSDHDFTSTTFRHTFCDDRNGLFLSVM